MGSCAGKDMAALAGAAVPAAGAAGVVEAASASCAGSDAVAVDVPVAGAAGAAVPGVPGTGAATAEAPGAMSADEPLRTYALTLGYNGAPFAGFARQPGQLTVQGNVEEALSLLFKQPVLTVCAGRTDAGVHAREQVVSFSVPVAAVRGRSQRTLLRSLNAFTHEHIVAKNIEERPESF